MDSSESIDSMILVCIISSLDLSRLMLNFRIKVHENSVLFGSANEGEKEVFRLVGQNNLVVIY